MVNLNLNLTMRSPYIRMHSIPLVVKPRPRVKFHVKRKTIVSSVDPAYLVGKSIILFTMFYTAMNWYTLKDSLDKFKK